ncbi:MAG: putative ribosome quality control (RQC) complex YloA/Tae2 family protein [Candidatus Nanohaloarchaea archaeon]|jgi:predicted ribosome quality control (RQC) complex YloA/Tae2 family protein
MELTSLDLSILMDDLKKLEDGHVQKVYQRDNELTLEVYIPGDGKERLIIGTDHVFLSKYKRDNPTRPPGFAMELRKHLGKIDSMSQRGFDRILEIKSGDTRLICEVFGKGNFILVKDDKIIGALRQEEWADRDILVGEEYVYPEPAPDPREMEDYIENLSEGEIVRRIASDLSLGGTYAEEICERTGVEKTKDVSELDEDERQSINSEIQNIIEEERFPVLYYDENGFPKRASPFRLETYLKMEEEEFESFSEALDEYYYTREKKQEEKQKLDAYNEKLEGLEAQKEQQERKIEGLKKSAEQKREDAEAIYENYNILHEIKTKIEEAIEEHGWDKTREMLDEKENELAERVNSLNEQNNFISIDIGNKNLKIYLDQDLEATASEFYDKAKESESKIESAEKALEETEKQIAELEKEDIELEEVMEDKSEKREKEWFEKYRWFYSSEGYLVLAGRDSQTNEMLVKKHMENNDLYFHADFDGAPSVVIKDGQDAGEGTLKEAAQTAVTFSKTWKAGIGADDVYYVDPEQVTENPESGEYLSKGAFVIRGDRDYMRNVEVSAAVGVYEIDGHEVPMCGPEEAVEENCEVFVNIRPGHKKKSDIAKEINQRFADEGYDLDLDYIIRVLPPGESEIEE